jgi:alpha-beta hydrolase superfamily lysophospholipase
VRYHEGKRLFGWLLPVPSAITSLVILHGWGGNAERMLPMALPFHRAGMNVLLVDARNHGRSDRHGFSSLPRFAEAPVLLVHGKADRTVPVEDVLTIVRECRRPHIRLFTIENAGHESVEKIKTHEDELVQFLRDIGFPLYSRVAT